MSTPNADLVMPTRGPLEPGLRDLLRSLKPGDPIVVIQTVRVGSRKWESAPLEGTFRHLDYLATGLATQRLSEDDLVVPLVHFTKPNGELTSIAIDERTLVKRRDANTTAPKGLE